MRHYLKVFASLICLLYLTACLTGKGRVRMPKEAEPYFDKTVYLSATGEGQSREEAGMRARASLSAIFESQVSSEVINRVSSIIEAGSDEKVSRDTEHNINVLSSVELKGLEVGAAWFDENDGFYHAVAVLERKTAAAQWRSEKRKIEREAEAILDSLDEQKSNFGKLRQLRTVKKLWLESEVIRSRLRVIGAPAGGSAIDMPDVLKKISAFNAGLDVYISVTGSHGKILAEKIAEALTPGGFNMSERKNGASVHIVGKMETKPVYLKNPSYEYARAIASIAIIDSTAELTLGEITENKRGAHITYDEAVNIAVRDVSSLVSKRVSNFMEGKDE